MRATAAEPPLSVAIVGPARVGKRALALALGAKPAALDSSSDDDDVFSWRGLQLRVVDEPQQLAPHRDSSGAAAVVVFVVVFDLTLKESFEAALSQWSLVVNGESTGHALLVGTKLDLPREREVFRAEALQAAEMQFDGAYVEVSAVQPSFVGVDEVKRLLSAWTGASATISSSTEPSRCASVPDVNCDAGSDTSLPPSPSQDADNGATSARRSPKRKPCVRASVWLYDPTEDHPPSPEHDIKLRPISRALFEIRSAAQDKLKAATKFRDREASKLLQRSKYYGPTESSRHMRWQEEQKRLAATSKQSLASSRTALHVRPRSASHGAVPKTSSADREREYERLAAKSFVQPTELLRQRKLELMAKKALLAANSATASRQVGSARNHGTRSLLHSHPHAAQQKQKRTRKLASVTLSSVPEEVRSAVEEVVPMPVAVAPSLLYCVAVDAMDAAVAQPAASPLQRVQRWCPPLDTSAPVDCAMDLVSPGADRDAALPTPVPTAHLQSPISPVASPPRERRATLSHVSFSFPSEHIALDVGMTTAVCEAVVSGETTHEVIEAIEASDSATVVVAAAAVEPATTTATTAIAEPFDINADIDDMLDYFDGVTLPI